MNKIAIIAIMATVAIAAIVLLVVMLKPKDSDDKVEEQIFKTKIEQKNLTSDLIGGISSIFKVL